MRFIFRWAFRLLVLAVVLIVSLVLLKDTLIKSFVTRQIRTQTGLEVKIAKFEAGLFEPTVNLEGIQVYYPPSSGGLLLAEIPELHWVYDRRALAAGEWHLQLVRLHLRELVLLNDEPGQAKPFSVLAELDRLRVPSDMPMPKLLSYDFAGIDVLNLTVEKIVQVRSNPPGKRAEIVLDLRNEVFKNVKSWPQFADLLLTRLLNKGITIEQPARTPSVESSPGRSGTGK